MATGKNSFVLYTSYVHSIELLTNEQAGKLFKHILNYVNDFDPKEDDVIVRVAFEPIKQQLKRDLKEWRTEKKKRSAAGKKGMKKRWEKPITNDKSVITEHNSVIKPITSITVDVNENVDVNVNDNVNVNVSERDNTAAQEIFYPIEHCVVVALNDTRWTKANHATEAKLKQFNGVLEKQGIYSKNPLDYKKHFANWSKGNPIKEDTKPKLTLDELRLMAEKEDQQ